MVKNDDMAHEDTVHYIIVKKFGLMLIIQGRLHKIKAGGTVLVPRANRGIFLLT